MLSHSIGENRLPTIVLVEQQTFVSDSVANTFREAFDQYAILECGENFTGVENIRADLKLLVITKSMLHSVYEKSRKSELHEGCFGGVPIALLGDAVDQDSLHFLDHSNLQGVFPNETPTNTLIAGLKFILEGGQYFPQKSNNLGVISSFVSEQKNDPSGDGSHASDVVFVKGTETVDPFTKRERAVLDCLAKGQPNKVIAGQLEIAENTIKIHIRNILKKLNVSNRTEAVLVAHKMSLVDLH